MIRRAALLLVVALVASSCAVLGFGGGCDGTEVVAEFEEVGDLVPNSNVQSADVVIGTIDAIELDQSEWQAEVTMCLAEGQRMAADVRASVRTTSLLGEKFVELAPQSPGPPYLSDGDIIDVSRTGKATELEEVFSKLATILGTGNLEKINKLTASQAEILEGREAELRALLSGLRRFTGTLAERKGEIAAAVDSLDNVSRTLLDDQAVLQEFLGSFARSSTVLSRQRAALQDLLATLDRFSRVSVRLLNATESGLDEQFRKLRPVLRTAAANSRELSQGLRTLATFTLYFPESMPGDYLQLDICRAGFHDYGQGTNCPQAIGNDDPDRSSRQSTASPATSLEFILRQPLRGDS